MTDQAQITTPPRSLPDWAWYIGVPFVGAVWVLVYRQLSPLSEWTTALFPVARKRHTGDAIVFFIYDVPKVLILLTLILLVSGVLHSWCSPDKTRAILSGRREVLDFPLTAANGLPEMIIVKQVLTLRLIATFSAADDARIILDLSLIHI